MVNPFSSSGLLRHTPMGGGVTAAILLAIQAQKPDFTGPAFARLYVNAGLFS